MDFFNKVIKTKTQQYKRIQVKRQVFIYLIFNKLYVKKIKKRGDYLPTPLRQLLLGKSGNLEEKCTKKRKTEVFFQPIQKAKNAKNSRKQRNIKQNN